MVGRYTNTMAVVPFTKLAAYATGGYKNTDPLPFLMSPMGPMGLLQGLFMQIGVRAMSVYEYMTKSGMSPVVVVCALCVGGIVFGVVAMIALTILLTPKTKED